LLITGCQKQKHNPKQVLLNYIIAANEHNIEKVYSMYSDSIVWYLGPFILKGKGEAIKPLWFDKGANTKLMISNVLVNGDTVDFNLLETNDVLHALGVNQLHHSPRFIFNDGLIKTILSTKLPGEFQAYADSISAFRKWLSENEPEVYNKFWPDGKFVFSEERGRVMPVEIKKWRERFNQTSN